LIQFWLKPKSAQMKRLALRLAIQRSLWWAQPPQPDVMQHPIWGYPQNLLQGFTAFAEVLPGRSPRLRRDLEVMPSPDFSWIVPLAMSETLHI